MAPAIGDGVACDTLILSGTRYLEHLTEVLVRNHEDAPHEGYASPRKKRPPEPTLKAVEGSLRSTP